MKLTKFIILFILLFSSKAFSEINVEFENWKNQFKTLALKNQISEKTFELTMSNVIFLPKVIEYDRFQPEFYEDTFTYIKKRTSDSKVKKGIKLYKNGQMHPRDYEYDEFGEGIRNIIGKKDMYFSDEFK